VHTIVEGEPLVIRVSSVIIPSATMDYFVPEKLPQPENYLESLVWDREKDIDRMRERFQLARALSQAKVAEAKYPRRSLFNLISSKVT